MRRTRKLIKKKMSFSCKVCGDNNAKKKCGGCQQTVYCSKKCQEQDWNISHQYECIEGGHFDIFAWKGSDELLFWKMAEQFRDIKDLVIAIAITELPVQDRMLVWMIKKKRNTKYLEEFFVTAAKLYDSNDIPGRYRNIILKLAPNIKMEPRTFQDSLEPIVKFCTKYDIVAVEAIFLEITKDEIYEGFARFLELLVLKAIKYNPKTVAVIKYLSERRDEYLIIQRHLDDFEYHIDEEWNMDLFRYLLSKVSKHITEKLILRAFAGFMENDETEHFRVLLENCRPKFNPANTCIMKMEPKFLSICFEKNKKFNFDPTMPDVIEGFNMGPFTVFPIEIGVMRYHDQRGTRRSYLCLKILLQNKKIDTKYITSYLLRTATLDDYKNPLEQKTATREDIEGSMLVAWDVDLLRMFLLERNDLHETISADYIRGVRDRLQNNNNKEREEIMTEFIQKRERQELPPGGEGRKKKVRERIFI